MKAPERVLDKVICLLSHERILAEVDQPIDQAIQVFQLETEGPLSHPRFNQIVTEFVRHVYQIGIRLPRYLSNTEALSEAVFLLERHYQGGYTMGYDGALLDAMDQNLEGLEWVLYRLGESVKEVERNKYINWVFAAHVDCLDWETRRRVVITYLDRYGEFLTLRLREISPGRLVESFQDLISIFVSSNDFMEQIFKLK